MCYFTKYVGICLICNKVFMDKRLGIDLKAAETICNELDVPYYNLAGKGAERFFRDKPNYAIIMAPKKQAYHAIAYMRDGKFGTLPPAEACLRRLAAASREAGIKQVIPSMSKTKMRKAKKAKKEAEERKANEGKKEHLKK